jgi:hypothetical protein
MGLSMTLYANDSKSWYPVMPVPANLNIWASQWLYGGVSGLFSLEQQGDGQTVGFGGGSATPGGSTYSNGNRYPLLGSYIEGFGVLTCPADKQDHCPPNTSPGVPFVYNPTNLNYPTGADVTIKRPVTPGKEQDVIQYNVSYLYIAGLKTDEANILYPAPIWGDETDCYDVGTLAWYGAGATGPNSQTPGSNYAGAPSAGRYGTLDNHGKLGANFVFTDGHGSFIKDNVHDTFFRSPTTAATTNGQNINLIDHFRSTRVQTID